MVYIPLQKKISIVPDLSDLPTTISWPRNQRLALMVLVVSGVWMIFAAGLAVVVFNLVPQLSYAMVLLLVGIVTLTAFLVGLSALRQYASQDEVTIDLKGIKTTTYGWLAVSKASFDWSDVEQIDSTPHTGGYELLTVRFPGSGDIALALSKNKGLIEQIKSRLLAMAKPEIKQN